MCIEFAGIASSTTSVYLFIYFLFLFFYLRDKITKLHTVLTVELPTSQYIKLQCD